MSTPTASTGFVLEPQRATSPTWSVLLYVSKQTGRVLGVDAACDRTEAANATEVLILRVASGLHEEAAWKQVQPDGDYGWVHALPGAVRINSYCVNVEWC